MRTRIISGAVLTLILIGAVAGGGLTMFILALVLSGIGMFELYRVVGIHKSALGISGYVLGALYYVLTWFGWTEYLLYYCVACGIITMFIYVCSFHKMKAAQAAFSLLGIFYVAVPISFIYHIRLLEYGIFLFALLFVCTWISDTFAYFIGSALGKHKLVPHLSPKKSVEGAVGGIISAGIIGLIYGLILGHFVGKNLGPAFMVIALIGGFISIFGDLAASAIKRNFDVKDYSHLIPGHGGILDRFDSMIFVAPIIYIGAKFLLPLF